MRRKRWLLLGVALLAVAGGALAFAAVGEGSEPATQDVTVPAAGASTSVQWTGTIPANTNPTSDCSQATGTVLNDSHGITVHVPSTGYSQLKTTFKFQISWTPANPSGDETLNDEILTVVARRATRPTSPRRARSARATVGTRRRPWPRSTSRPGTTP